MTNEIQLFKFNDHPVRIVEKDGEPWWVAKDVCDVLELTNSRMSVESLEEDEKGVSNIYTPGGMQSMTVISEAGLYSLILRSRKPQAKAFQRWVTHDVLPTIRKTGSYSMKPQLPQNYLEALEALVEKEKERLALSAKIEEDKPKVALADAITATDDDILIRDMAKILRQNGFLIGQNRLFETLRDKGYLIKRGTDKNRPTQRAMELGLFRVQEIPLEDLHVITFTTRVTPKGQQYLLKAFQDGLFD